MKALVNYEIAKEFTIVTGIEAIPLMPYNKLDKPVASHPDMLFCILDNTAFCYKDYVEDEELFDIIKQEGYDVVFVSKCCNKEYPDDISLNVLIMGKTLFCNRKYAAQEIIDFANKKEYKIVNVKQGYSACSTLVIDENHAITGDRGMYEAIVSSGKSALLVKTEDIVLNGYNHGFIGGATAVLGDKILFFGAVNTLYDKDKIISYISDLKCTFFSISLDRVYDFGGIKLI